MLKSIKINSNDNVAVAIDNLKKDELIESITLIDDIPKGHKFALIDFKENDEIIKYGFPIGKSTREIKKGEHVHTHNLKTNLKGLEEYNYVPQLNKSEEVLKGTFKGYLRENGDVGIRNEIWIINTVGCVNKVAEKIALESNKRFAGKTDGIFTFVHPFGCSQMGDDQINTQKILRGLVKHPNAAGVLVLGLGCENNNIPVFKEFVGEYDEDRVKFLNAQDSDDELEDGLRLIGELVDKATTYKRKDLSISKLKIGLKCGGSDGFSGITANPLVGVISDILVTYGGTSILTEVPEMFGAETILMNRCVNEDLFNKTVDLINDFKKYFMRYDQEIYENPSPGNKAGGISTLEDKSLGCTQKCGFSNVTSVLDYGEMTNTHGLNLLNGPGNDIVAITNLASSGAHMILFTTGRGTPVGGPVPTVKISSNTDLFLKKPSWIDFDAGIILKDKSMEEVSKDFWEFIIKIANGEIYTKNEENGYREISIFKNGVTL